MNRLPSFRALCVLVSFVCLYGCPKPPKPSAQPVENGGFDQSLSGWTTVGDVEIVDGSAELADTGEDYSRLVQTVDLNTGRYNISFDFANHMSPELSDPDSGFGFPDICFVSLYFTDNLETFSLETGTSQNYISLFDLDFEGAYNVTGTITQSNRGAEWRHFTVQFQNNWHYAIPIFELNDMNGIPDDSYVLVDNVVITPVG